MRIDQGTFAVFWSRPSWPRAAQFHADVRGKTTAREAVADFLATFPGDVVRSVRDASGRFLAFKN